MQIWNLEHSTSNKNFSKEYFRKILLFPSIIGCGNQMILQIMIDCDHPVQRTTIFQTKHTLKKSIYFWLCWIFVAEHRLSPVAASGSYSPVAWHGLQSLWASVAAALRLSSCSSQALECRLRSCGTPAQLPCSMWDLLGPGTEVVSATLAGRFITTRPLGTLRHTLKRQPLTGLMYVIKITLS